MNKTAIYIFSLLHLMGCTSRINTIEEKIVVQTFPENGKMQLELAFNKGKEFNHPSMVVWTETVYGKYLETIFITQYVGTGNFGHGERKPGQWDNKPGEARRPSSLPYWAHKRNIKAPDGLYIPAPETAVADAVTAATPTGSFLLKTASASQEPRFRLLFEINQPWDSNKFWTNSKYPGNMDYFTSLQPSLVFAVTIETDSETVLLIPEIIGHGHPTGENGELFTDVSTLTTAKEIIKNIEVRILR